MMKDEGAERVMERESGNYSEIMWNWNGKGQYCGIQELLNGMNSGKNKC